MIPVDLAWEMFRHRPTEDQIREEAYYMAEADQFQLSSEFYWNLAKEQLEEKVMIDFDFPTESIIKTLEKNTFLKVRVLVARAKSKECVQVNYTKIPFEFLWEENMKVLQEQMDREADEAFLRDIMFVAGHTPEEIQFEIEKRRNFNA